MNDYELLYYVFQKDEEALEMLIRKYEKNLYFTVRKVMNQSGYSCETSDELNEIMQTCRLELYQAIYNYRDTGTCSFYVYALKCVEMGVRKHIRHKRCGFNYMFANALRLDAKVKEDGDTYMVDVLQNQRKDFEGASITKWHHEENIYNYLKDHLKKKEFIVAESIMKGYTLDEIRLEMGMTYKQIYYIRCKIRNLLLSYID